MLSIVFAVLVFLAMAVAFGTRDWRLKVMVASFASVWLTTRLLAGPGLHSPWWLDPLYTLFLFLAAFFIQARGEAERARGEPLAMWLLVPMGVETVIALSYVAGPSLSPLAQLVLIQLGFAIELVCVIVVGGRRLRLGQRAREVWRAVATVRFPAAPSDA